MAGILYYTDNQCQERILLACRKQLMRCIKSHNIVSISQYPIPFQNNIVMPLSRSIISMYRQIIRGLEALKDDFIFFAEHDVLYHPNHFDFVPKEEKYYFNTNVWTVKSDTGECMYADCMERTSCMVAFRDILMDAYTEKLCQAEEYFETNHKNFAQKYGYEPKNFLYEHFRGEEPNLDIKHGNNITRPRFDLNQYSNTAKRIIGNSFILTDRVPYWGKMGENFDNFLRSV